MNVYELIDEANHQLDVARTAADNENFVTAESHLRELCLFLSSQLSFDKNQKPLKPTTEITPGKELPMKAQEIITEIVLQTKDAQRLLLKGNNVKANSRLMALCVFLADNLPWAKGLRPTSPSTKPEPATPPTPQFDREEMRQIVTTIFLHQLYTIACLGQTAPDGENCAICDDTDHQAFECHFNAFVRWRKEH